MSDKPTGIPSLIAGHQRNKSLEKKPVALSSSSSSSSSTMLPSPGSLIPRTPIEPTRPATRSSDDGQKMTTIHSPANQTPATTAAAAVTRTPMSDPSPSIAHSKIPRKLFTNSPTTTPISVSASSSTTSPSFSPMPTSSSLIDEQYDPVAEAKSYAKLREQESILHRLQAKAAADDLFQAPSTDVIIIGAGISGLTAAYHLLQKRPSLSVVVLEAHDRVGGRTMSSSLSNFSSKLPPSVTIDLGGMWISNEQKHISALADELGVQTVDQFHAGKKIAFVDNVCNVYSSDIPFYMVHILWACPACGNCTTFSQPSKPMRKKIDVENPCDYEYAREWDSISVETWMKGKVTNPDVAALFESVVRGVWGVEPADVSLLSMLHYTNCSNGIERLINIKNGHQEKQFVGGSQQISEKLRKKVEGFKNARVLLSHPVAFVTQTSSSVTVTTHSHQSFTASFLISALPPVMLSSIHFSPSLSSARHLLCQRSFMGSIIKSIVIYPRAFWRDAGFSGEVVADCKNVDTDIVFNVYDYCKKGKDGAEIFALVCFSNGEVARRWSDKSEDERREATLKQIDLWFGNKKGVKKGECLSPLAYIEKNWVIDEWTKGCPVNNLPTGALFTSGHQLRAVEGRVHWASTETATTNQGFMDGAVQAGRRAADEVLSRFSSPSSSSSPPLPSHTAVVQKFNRPTRRRSFLRRLLRNVLMLLLLLFIVANIVHHTDSYDRVTHVVNSGIKRIDDRHNVTTVYKLLEEKHEQYVISRETRKHLIQRGEAMWNDAMKHDVVNQAKVHAVKGSEVAKEWTNKASLHAKEWMNTASVYAMDLTGKLKDLVNQKQKTN